MLTTAQMQALKAAIVADPALLAIAQGAGTDYQAVANALNTAASPALVVWRTAVGPEERRGAITAGAIQLDNLTVGKRDALLYVCQGTLDCRVQTNRDT